MKLTVLALKLLNFKGKREYVLNPNEGLTSVNGTNQAGKTTLCDAWLWLWTGKDTKGRTDYEIKTKDQNGDVDHHLDHQVEATIEVDGEKYEISRTYKEKWVKRTGEEFPVLDSHTTEYIWDTIPLATKKEYDFRVSKLFGDSEKLDLLSNPRFFLNMAWEKRRKILMSLAGVTDEGILRDLAASNPDFAGLLKEIDRNDLSDFRKKLNSEKKKLKDKIKEIPVKIREATLAIPEEPDYAWIEKQIGGKREEIKSIESLIDNETKAFRAKADAIKAKQNEILSRERRIAEIKNAVRIEIENFDRVQNKGLTDLNNQLRQLETSIKSLRSDQALVINKIHNSESDYQNQVDLLDGLRKKIYDLDAQEIDPSSTACSMCGTPFTGDKLDSIVASFNSTKAEKIKQINERGTREASQRDLLLKSLENLNRQKEDLASQISNKENEKMALLDAINMETNKPKQALGEKELLDGNEEYQLLLSEIETLKGEIETIPEPDTSEFRRRISEINSEIDEFNRQLSNKSTAERQKVRVKELEVELKSLSQELATLEGKEFIAEKFNRAKIEAIENGINGLFASIKWKMFNQLIGGGEEECCDALIVGVPYQAANNAAQINAGIECINTLSKFYDMYLPIFVDNAEAVVELIPSESQVIRFVVDEACQYLTVK